MMMNKYSLPTILMLTLIAGSAQATVLINDNYYGGSYDTQFFSGLNAETNDIIGTEATFDISKMEVTIGASGGLQVDLHTRFLDNNGTTGGNGSVIELGDLFISTGWNPYGSAPYGEDVAVNGESWEYVLVLDDHADTSGTLSLYAVDEDRIIHSDNNITDPGGAIPSGGTIENGYRPGQEVQYDTRGLSSIYTGSWAILGDLTDGNDQNDYLSFSFNAFDMGISEDNFGLHWTMTCANDIIEGGANVPEPSTMLLFGAGLTGLIGRNAFRRNKKK